MVSNAELTQQIQKVELGILGEFQRICKDYNLRYFAIGGSCIGAIRHKGFIPWDDDIDVAMPQEDYYRFIRIAEKKMRHPYKLVTPDSSRYYNVQYIRVENEETAFIQDYVADLSDRWGGIFMDVMPVTGLPSDKKERSRYLKKLKKYKRLNRYRRMPFSYDPSMKWRVIWVLFSAIKWMFPYNFYSRKMDALRAKYSFDMSGKVCFSWDRHRVKGLDTKKDFFNYKDFAETIEVPFEDTTICVPVGYDRYLKTDFGDYMKLPPEGKRVSIHPTVLIDISKSYKEYKKTGLPKVNGK